jgi:hypothetical protein
MPQRRALRRCPSQKSVYAGTPPRKGDFIMPNKNTFVAGVADPTTKYEVRPDGLILVRMGVYATPGGAVTPGFRLSRLRAICGHSVWWYFSSRSEAVAWLRNKDNFGELSYFREHDRREILADMIEQKKDYSCCYGVVWDEIHPPLASLI